MLAAGASRRMGAPKGLLPLEGRPILQHVLEAAAASGVFEIVLVVNPTVEARLGELALPAGVPTRVVVNARESSGIGDSLGLGLAAARGDASAAVILLGDQPRVRPAVIERVARAFEKSGKPCARSVYSGAQLEHVPAHPVFVARKLWPEVMALSGGKGLAEWLSRHPENLQVVECEGTPPGDIDTPCDYAAACDAGSDPA
ncbi:MAG: nucleotidyltransferase family protein [Myxococcota bacterium]